MSRDAAPALRDGIVEPAAGRADPEAGWRRVVDALPGFVLLLNDDYVCINASARTADLLAIEPQDLIGQRPEGYVDVTQLPQVWRSRAAANTGMVGTHRVPMRCGDGIRRWFEVTVTKLPDPLGRYGFVTMVYGRDVMAEIDLDRVAMRGELRYRTVLELVDEPLLQISSLGVVESFNTKALQVLRREPVDLLGADFLAVLDVHDEDGRPLRRTALPLLMAPGAGEVTEVWRSVVRGDGQRVVVQFRIAPFDSSDGTTHGSLVLMRERGTVPRQPGGMVSHLRARAAAGLTAREGDVLDGLAAGRDVPRIAEVLGISVHSVRGHVKSITAKLGVHSQLQAVLIAIRSGYVDISRDWSPPPRRSR